MRGCWAGMRSAGVPACILPCLGRGLVGWAAAVVGVARSGRWGGTGNTRAMATTTTTTTTATITEGRTIGIGTIGGSRVGTRWRAGGPAGELVGGLGHMGGTGSGTDGAAQGATRALASCAEGLFMAHLVPQKQWYGVLVFGITCMFVKHLFRQVNLSQDQVVKSKLISSIIEGIVQKIVPHCFIHSSQMQRATRWLQHLQLSTADCK